MEVKQLRRDVRHTDASPSVCFETQHPAGRTRWRRAPSRSCRVHASSSRMAVIISEIGLPLVLRRHPRPTATIEREAVRRNGISASRLNRKRNRLMIFELKLQSHSSMSSALVADADIW